MPLPVPRDGEKQEDFMSRCMEDKAVQSDFEDEKQQVAVCNSQWEATKAESSLTAPIAWKDESKRVVYGPVLVPNIADSDGDIVTADKIELVAHKFLEDYRLMEHMHTLRSVARPVESYIAPVDLHFNGVKVPKGSWVVGAHVVDDEAWKSVQAGQLTGFSVVAIPTMNNKSVNKRLTLTEIEKSGMDWEVIAIGLVDRPAVPLAKWVAIKQEEGTWNKIKGMFGKESVANEGSDEVEVSEEQLRALIGEAVQPLVDRIAVLETPPEAPPDPEPDPDDDAEEDEAQEETKELAAATLQAASKAGAEEAFNQLLEYIDSRPKASVKSLTESLRGQDGHATKSEEETTRDPWGRRVRS